jgi:hypothetical protein
MPSFAHQAGNGPPATTPSDRAPGGRGPRRRCRWHRDRLRGYNHPLRSPAYRERARTADLAALPARSRCASMQAPRRRDSAGFAADNTLTRLGGRAAINGPTDPVGPEIARLASVQRRRSPRFCGADGRIPRRRCDCAKSAVLATVVATFACATCRWRQRLAVSASRWPPSGPVCDNRQRACSCSPWRRSQHLRRPDPRRDVVANADRRDSR